MVRPQKVPVVTATPGWDAAVNQNLDNIYDKPLPPFQATDLTDLTTNFPASQYEQCIAIAGDTKIVYYSNGTTWNRLVPLMAYDASPTATTLRDELVAVGLMAPS